MMVGFDQSEAESKNILLSKNVQIVQGIDEFWAFSNDHPYWVVFRMPSGTLSTLRMQSVLISAD